MNIAPSVTYAPTHAKKTSADHNIYLSATERCPKHPQGRRRVECLEVGGVIFGKKRVDHFVCIDCEEEHVLALEIKREEHDLARAERQMAIEARKLNMSLGIDSPPSISPQPSLVSPPPPELTSPALQTVIGDLVTSLASLRIGVALRQNVAEALVAAGIDSLEDLSIALISQPNLLDPLLIPESVKVSLKEEVVDFKNNQIKNLISF
jgi:hypothetical protein